VLHLPTKFISSHLHPKVSDSMMTHHHYVFLNKSLNYPETLQLHGFCTETAQCVFRMYKFNTLILRNFWKGLVYEPNKLIDIYFLFSDGNCICLSSFMV
jgi:hypothetical protein